MFSCCPYYCSLPPPFLALTPISHHDSCIATLYHPHVAQYMQAWGPPTRLWDSTTMTKWQHIAQTMAPKTSRRMRWSPPLWHNTRLKGNRKNADSCTRCAAMVGEAVTPVTPVEQPFTAVFWWFSMVTTRTVDGSWIQRDFRWRYSTSTCHTATVYPLIQLQRAALCDRCDKKECPETMVG